MNTLYTKRLILRPFREDDAEAMFKNWTQDERVAKYCRWYPHADISQTIYYLNFCLETKYSWAITLKDIDEPIGAIDLSDKNDNGVNEIGYVLAYNYWGKGIMTEAVNSVIKELFNSGFDKLGAKHEVNNVASGKVLEKCGMIYIGNAFAQKKFGSDEQCEVKCYEISK